MKKIRIDPTVIFLVVFAAFCGYARNLLHVFFALLLHELGHMAAARKRGFMLSGFRITLLGATIGYDCGLNGKDEFYVSLWGPAANLITCVILVALWWVFPSCYVFTYGFFQASFSLALFNLMPIVPFDGGRIILSLVKNKLRFLRASRIIGFVFSAVFLVLGILSLSLGYGFSLIFTATTILWSNLFDAPNERYRVIFTMSGAFDSPYKPYVYEVIEVDGQTQLKELLPLISKKGTSFKVLLLSGEEKRELPSDVLESFFYAERSMTVGDAVKLSRFPISTVNGKRRT